MVNNTCEFKSFDDDAEVLGRVLVSAMSCLNYDSLAEIIKTFDLSKINPDQWYPLQLYLDFLKAVSEDHNSMFNFVSLGMSIAKIAEFPPVFETMPFVDVLMSVTQAYNMDHRGGDYGSLTAELVSENHLKYRFKSPYPSDLLYGTTYGLAHRFAEHRENLVVKYGEPDGEFIVLEVLWK